MIEINEFIENMAKTDKYIPVIFTNGSCYKFAKFLQLLYGGEIVINESKNHVGLLVEDKVYDIDGESTEKFTKMTEEDVKNAEEWGFFENNLMSMGECDHCGEELIITQYDE